MRWIILALAILLIAMLLLSFNASHYGALVLIGPIPIVVASDISIAIFLILLTFLILSLLLIFSFLGKAIGEVKIEPKAVEKEKKFGGVVLIGPLPIIFGEARMAIVASILAIILMLLALLFIFR